MHDTYSTLGRAARQYQILAEMEALGWQVEAAHWEGYPFLLFRALTWVGDQPRYVLTAQDVEFLPALLDLHRLGMRPLNKPIVTLIIDEEPLWFEQGLTKIKDEQAEQLWWCLTGEKDVLQKEGEAAGKDAAAD